MVSDLDLNSLNARELGFLCLPESYLQQDLCWTTCVGAACATKKYGLEGGPPLFSKVTKQYHPELAGGGRGHVMREETMKQESQDMEITCFRDSL